MNLIDVIGAFLFLAIFSVGFFAGAGRTVAALLGLAVGLIAAGIFSHALAGALTSIFWPMPDWIAEVAAFVIVLAVIGTLVIYGLLWSFRVSRLRTRGVWESRGGLVASLLVVILAAVLALGVTTTVAQLSDWTAREMVSQEQNVMLRDELADSILAPNALRLSPYLYRAVGAWLPGEVPSILEPAS